MLPNIVCRVDRRQPVCRSTLPLAAFLPHKNSKGLFSDGKSDDDKEENRRNTCVFQGPMSLAALICTWGPCKVVRPCGERRTHRSGEGCPLGSARPERRLRPTQKRVCPCQAKVSHILYSQKRFCYQIGELAPYYLYIGSRRNGNAPPKMGRAAVFYTSIWELSSANKRSSHSSCPFGAAPQPSARRVSPLAKVIYKSQRLVRGVRSRHSL